ncbi:hypothetical protein SDC9_100076 [bioreactor metagenome]|uniref:Holin n=1 Tax=bioreactor metagenome TaxID=1076179 RepID=A0A645AJH9_9ZZZZ
MPDITALITSFGILVGITTIITEVLKKILWNKIPTSLLAFIVSQLITISAFISYCAFNSIPIMWYYFLGVIVSGFMVAYAAMFGFDKLREIITSMGIKDKEQ